jgi:hypothetical protein
MFEREAIEISDADNVCLSCKVLHFGVQISNELNETTLFELNVKEKTSF